MTDAQLNIENYDYDLPKHLIAQNPVANRSDARLLVVDRQDQSLSHFHVRDLPEVLRPGDLLIANDTKVIPAKLVGYRKSTGGRWQGLFLDADEHGNWKVLAKTRGNIQEGETVVLKDREGADRMELTIATRLNDGAWAVRPETGGEAEELLAQIGRVPLPHYIREGNMVEKDLHDYQTVFAREPGAVAAPTAGLHLTDPLIEQLKEKGVAIEAVTLHVGIGTFRPIKVSRIDEHEMHSEQASLSANVAEKIRETREKGGRVIAIGTTSVRVLETVGQQGGDSIEAWTGPTDLFVFPGFEFKVVNGLMTNFHLPRTSLLVMIRTFGGDALIKKAYKEAIKQNYRFFSYGDAMLIV